MVHYILLVSLCFDQKFTQNLNYFILDCESLIRKMLVLDPTRRFTIDQIKRHRWMIVEALETPNISSLSLNVSSSDGGTASMEPNEQILKIMQNLGIDIQKTRESLKVS